MRGFAGGCWQEVQLCATDQPMPGGEGGGGVGGAGGGGVGGGGAGGGGSGGGKGSDLPHLLSAGLHGTVPLYVLQSIDAVP